MDFNEANLIVKYSHKISELAKIAAANNNIETEMYEKYDVKRGLRDKNGKGVLCGLTEISEVTSWEEKEGKRTPVPGVLCQRFGKNLRRRKPLRLRRNGISPAVRKTSGQKRADFFL